MLFLAVLLLGLTACNKKLGPEYSSFPEITNVHFEPAADITSNDDVRVTATITSEYGLHSAWVVFWLNDEVSTAQKTKETFYDATNHTSVSHAFSTYIPKQDGGVKVSFQVIAYSPFGTNFLTNSMEYTVLPDGEPEEPEEPEEKQ